jgi:hypothetical protein
MRLNFRFLLLITLTALFFEFPAKTGCANTGVNHSQQQATAQALAAEWDGVWKGNLNWTTADGKKQEFGMELRVAPVAGTNAKTWKIIYTGQPERPYEISPVAGEPGHFVIDEKNGLFIDAYLSGNVLRSLFLVSDNFISTRFENQGDSILVELTTFNRNSPRQSKITNGDFEVSAYRFGSVQRGTLKRQ